MAAKLTLISCVLVAVFESYFCFLINDINPKMLAASVLNDDNGIDQVTTASMLKQISFTFPGTKWCGPGNIADNYDDLGPEVEADTCCRQHDYCPDTIDGGGTKHNLTNTAFYSRLNCNCDTTFYDCLKSANTKTALLIGNVYFDALQTKCFKLEYPAIKCVKRGGWFQTKCLKHTYDRSKEKLYQWFDVPDF